jgi:hypothetical protein
MTVATRRACGLVWPLRMRKMVSQRKRIPAVARPTMLALKKRRTRRVKRS